MVGLRQTGEVWRAKPSTNSISPRRWRLRRHRRGEIIIFVGPAAPQAPASWTLTKPYCRWHVCCFSLALSHSSRREGRKGQTMIDAPAHRWEEEQDRLRAEWERAYPNVPWNDVRLGYRYGWEQAG